MSAKLAKHIKRTLVFSSICNVLSLTWFILGRSRLFQGNGSMADLGIFVLFIIPSIAIILCMMIPLIKGYTTKAHTPYTQAFSCVFLAIAALVLFINTTSFELRENVTLSDTPQLIEDGSFTYHLEWKDSFFTNTNPELVIRLLDTDKEKRITLNIENEGGNRDIIRSQDKHWVNMEATINEGTYRLSTTLDFKSDEVWVFYIDLEAKESVLIKKKYRAHVRYMVQAQDVYRFILRINLIHIINKECKEISLEVRKFEKDCHGEIKELGIDELFRFTIPIDVERSEIRNNNGDMIIRGLGVWGELERTNEENIYLLTLYDELLISERQFRFDTNEWTLTSID